MGASASQTVASEFAQPRQIEALESAYGEAIEQWKQKILLAFWSRQSDPASQRFKGGG
jgi:hypothetical protein